MPTRTRQELRRRTYRLLHHRRRGAREAREAVDSAGEDEEDIRKGRVGRTSDREHLKFRRHRVHHLLRKDGVLSSGGELFRVYDEEWVRER